MCGCSPLIKYTVDPGYMKYKGDCEIVHYIDNLKYKVCLSEPFRNLRTSKFPQDKNWNLLICLFNAV